MGDMFNTERKLRINSKKKKKEDKISLQKVYDFESKRFKMFFKK